MRRKILLLIVAAILLVQFIQPVNAAKKNEPSVTVVSGYHLGDTLYSFIRKNTDEPLSKMEINLQINGYLFDNGLVFDSVEKSRTPASYMLLIDLSTSMPGYRDRVSSFAKALMQSRKTDMSISVASFGEEFRVIAKNLTRIDKLTAVVDGLEYNQNATDICGGVNKALKYLSNTKRKEGELVNLVIITDGVPYLPDSMANHQQIIENSAKKTKKYLSKTSDVVVHSLGFSTWNPTTIDAISEGSGLHLTAYSAYDAQSAADEIANFSNSLCPLQFAVNISDNVRRFNSNLLINFKNKSVIESVKEKDIVNLNALYKINSVKSFDIQQIIGAENGRKEKPSKGKEKTTVSAEKTTEESVNIAADNKQPANAERTDNQFPINIVIAYSASLVVLLSAIILTIIKLREKAQSTLDAKIEMKIEVIKGNCKNTKDIVTLTKELTVGRRSSCDIVFADKSIAPKNTRIYINNDMIYIENIGNEINTAIGGMKIYSPNRLRSGDEITVGNSVFKLRF